MIHTGPYDELAALMVFRHLDVSDLREAALARGAEVSHLTLFREWGTAQQAAALSVIMRDAAGVPFAVLAVVPVLRGVAQAAFLARSHHKFRRALIGAAVKIRRELPVRAAGAGLNRIEARSWAGHPTAGRFLAACGFTFEAEVRGYGGDGSATFHQYAWIKGDTDHVQHT